LGTLLNISWRASLNLGGQHDFCGQSRGGGTMRRLPGGTTIVLDEEDEEEEDGES